MLISLLAVVDFGCNWSMAVITNLPLVNFLAAADFGVDCFCGNRRRFGSEWPPVVVFFLAPNDLLAATANFHVE